MAREVREGQTEDGLPYLSFGSGPPLVVFPGLGMTNANPSGIQRRGEMRLLAPWREGSDRFYPTELFRETAEGIPNARLIIYEDRGHGGALADRRFSRDVNAFLLADHSPDAPSQ